MASPQNILVIGAGSWATNPKQKKIDSLQKLGIHVVPTDIIKDDEQTLSLIFARYDTIIGCTGFVSGRGTQVKLTRTAISSATGRTTTTRYIPWQFGVDYDIIGRGSVQDVFDEQLDVRGMLRSSSQTDTNLQWTIISTGMFTSFLFEPSFGVVDLENASICALGSWENRVTLTTPADIGRITAEIVLGLNSSSSAGTTISSDPSSSPSPDSGKVLFIGGDTISYAELASLVERESSLLNVGDAQNALGRDPGNALLKYQVVFEQGQGVSWDLEGTWNWQRGIRAMTTAEWAEGNLTIV
ncbi:isoflavone reductase family protein [Aspergillus ruber CBS 135680]|uniref:Isoflavone reductase family protein n=1 Tax=Aspergillus ruber (strain CBS 135680) TaxID=1388766 RepID=A0A017SG42_ASPRC|nr:isoflavone reductase family protein [Aspergillus ruber CBS 135680]EYE95250.1 isoflavone reductase family protein [Aspergillus ruber CBS 135680]